MKCEICEKPIEHCNLSSNHLYLCKKCLDLEDLVQRCKEQKPCEVKEEYEGDVKHIKKVYKVDDETTVEVCCDEKVDLRSELQRENQQLRQALNDLQKRLLNLELNIG